VKKYTSGVILMLGMLLQTVHAQQSFSGNPILPGWYADPEAVVFGKQYWIYPTYSDKYEKQVFFDAFSSDDLIRWKKHEHILDTSAIRWAKRAMWAPAIVKKDDQYYFFFAANDIQNNQEYGGIGVAVADKPEGPYKDYLGKPLIGQFYNGAQPIDQFVLRIRTANTILYTEDGSTAISRSSMTALPVSFRIQRAISSKRSRRKGMWKGLSCS